MLLRLFMCLVFIQAIIFEIVDCRAHQVHKLRNHHVNQFGHHHTAQVQDRDEPSAATSESQLQQLRFPGEASSDNLTSDTHRHLVGRRGDDHDMVAICTLCPLSQEIYPCQCSCLNGTVAQLSCSSNLDSCTQLTDILSLTVFPTSHYLRLVVDDTSLACKIQEDMWGTLTFQEIIMMDNHFHTLDNHAFMPFSNTLKLLNLVRNSLTNVYFPTMSDQPYLEALLLDHNKITFIPGYTVMALPFLKILKVSHNKMYQIQPYTFAGLPSLEVLDLSHNSITKLYQGSLTIPDHLAPTFTIDLSNNLISYIEPGVMEGVKACQINLQHNQLINLPEDVYRPIIDLTRASARLWVAGNPFNCNSYFCWIAVNTTVSDCFDKFRCPNLGNETLESIMPRCPIKPGGRLATAGHTRGRRQPPAATNQHPKPALLPAMMAKYNKPPALSRNLNITL